MICGIFFSAFPGSLHGDSFKSHQVKAVFLYNLTNFVSWPDNSFENRKTQLKICILGEDPFHGLLEKVIEGETVNGRPLTIIKVKALKDLEPCHLLVVSPSMKTKLISIFKAIDNQPVLTVGDFDGFSYQGGMVNLVPKENRIHVEINIDSTRKAGLEISAKLLNLATIIDDVTVMVND